MILGWIFTGFAISVILEESIAKGVDLLAGSTLKVEVFFAIFSFRESSTSSNGLGTSSFNGEDVDLRVDASEAFSEDLIEGITGGGDILTEAISVELSGFAFEPFTYTCGIGYISLDTKCTFFGICIEIFAFEVIVALSGVMDVSCGAG